MVSKKQLSAPFYNISQLRVEFWNDLKQSSALLLESKNGSASKSKRYQKVMEVLEDLKSVESYFGYPGMRRMNELSASIERKEFTSASHKISEITRQLVSDRYRSIQDSFDTDESDIQDHNESEKSVEHRQNYFEVLFVEDISKEDEQSLRLKFKQLEDPNKQFTYNVVVQRSFQDALISLLFNYNIQSVVIRYAPAFSLKEVPKLIRPYVQTALNYQNSTMSKARNGPELGRFIKQFRPELDTFYVTDTALSGLEDSTIKTFNRIFYRSEDLQEIHLSILRGIRERYETPFFSALTEYSQKPTGVFHAMPISRGNSVFQSRWIRDFGDFYGRNMFLAETSATTGGLDSLLQPTGPLKKAQELARDAYGSQNTFFVTNGTSTANKIVMQALVKPGDVVLIDRDCHKSHHYGILLSGAFPVYLDSYPIEQYSMYGAVPLSHIKQRLFQLKAAGRLDKVKMLLLTNCTFDGLVYNVEQVMQEVLAIKPDMIFVWDEAWFAFAGFTYTFKQRTAMFTAKKLYDRYKTKKYKQDYISQVNGHESSSESSLPDPDKVKIRVYSTQSTHKTLSSFRQGSMIHIWDEDFRRKSESTFLEAYMTHTSTSPNYQMLASLDAGRRQVQFEGFELVEKSIEMAMILRAKIINNSQLNKYFDVLTIKDFIPDKFRKSNLSEYYDKTDGWNRMEDAWEKDEFILDPTKITLHIGRTGVDGDTFKNKFLMDKFNIQINKTSRNTVLFMTNIGTTRGSITYLTNALLAISDQLDEEQKAMNTREAEIHQKRIHSLTKDLPPLPDFSHFHHSFQASPGVPGGNLREGYFLAYDEDNYEYIPLDNCLSVMAEGKVLVASSFVIPYPPGFPVLVPGQVVSKEIVQFMLALDVSEIHGYRADLGLRVFKQKVLNRQQTSTSMGARAAITSNKQ